MTTLYVTAKNVTVGDRAKICMPLNRRGKGLRAYVWAGRQKADRSEYPFEVVETVESGREYGISFVLINGEKHNSNVKVLIERAGA